MPRKKESLPKIETTGDIQAEYLARETAAEFAFSNDTGIPYDTYRTFLIKIHYLKNPDAGLPEIYKASNMVKIPKKVPERDRILIEKAQTFLRESPEVKRALNYWEAHKKILTSK